MERKFLVSKSSLAFGFILLALTVLRLPFILTHHFLDDAFITFRTAVNLADHGDYSFNLNARDPGTTSVLYTLLVAAVRLIFRGHFLLAVEFANSLMASVASYLLAATFTERGRIRTLAWIAAAASPTCLLLSYLGMETSMLILVFSLGLYLVRVRPQSALLYVCIASLPLIRPDALMEASLLALALLLRRFRWGILAIASVVLGCTLLLFFNYITSGQFVTTTMVAKKLHYAPDLGLKASLGRVSALFLTHSFLVPIDRGSIQRTLAPLATITAVLTLWWLICGLRSDAIRRNLALVVASVVLFVPVVFAFGGIIQFPWYFEPSAWLLESVAALCLIRWVTDRPGRVRRAVILGAVCTLWISMAGLRLIGSLSRGTQGYLYCGDMGRYLAKVAHPGETLFLEPAGLVPFLSHLRTDDEVGLVSQRVVEYHRRYPVDWWPRFVEQEQPTYLLERSAILEGWTYHGYRLTQEQRRSLAEHYCLLQHYHYEATHYHQSRLLKWILMKAENPVEDWVIYARRSEGVSCPASGNGT